MKKLIGIDLGGTTVKIAILNLAGEIHQKWSMKTDISNNGENIVPSIIKSIQQQLKLYGIPLSEIIGIGMGSPGTVDIKNGTVTGAYNLGWKTTQRIKEQIETGIGLPFF